MLLRLHEELKLSMVVVEHDVRFVMKTFSDLAVLSFGRKLTQAGPRRWPTPTTPCSMPIWEVCCDPTA